jgi:hypothetical protein
MFPIKRSHLKRIAFFCVYYECINHFGSFIFKICKLWVDDKATWDWLYNLGGGRESKTSKGECESFCNQIRIISPILGPKMLEATVLYNDTQHDILALQSRANKIHGQGL